MGGKWDARLYEGVSWRELGEKEEGIEEKSTQTITGSGIGRKTGGENKHGRGNSRGSTICYGFSVCNGADEMVKARETQMS